MVGRFSLEFCPTTPGRVALPAIPTRPTRELILRGEALVCFAMTGYEGTSLNDIAAGVGIRRRACSTTSRQGGAVRRGLRAPALGLVRAPRGRSQRPRTGVGPRSSLVLRRGFSYFVDNPAFVRLVRRRGHRRRPHLGIDLAAVLRPMFDLAKAYLAREMAAGTFRQQDPEQLCSRATAPCSATSPTRRSWWA